MKTLLPIYFLITCICGNYAYGQSDSKSYVKKIFHQINADTSLVKVVLENEEFLVPLTDGGGTLTGYYKGTELRKIVRWIGISHGTELIEFYLQSSQLLFVYEQFNSFVYDSKADSIRFNETERTFEGRYWFDRGKLFNQLTTGHNRFEDDTLDPSIIWPAEAKEMKRLLDKKMATLNSR